MNTGLFKKKYDRNDFINFLKNVFLPNDFIPNVTEVFPQNITLKYTQRVTLLGNCPSLELVVFEIQHLSDHDARISLSREAFKLLSTVNQNRALILFVPNTSDNYRFSLVSVTPKLDENGKKVLYEYSNPRRYSFLLGPNAKTHTPERFLIQKGRVANYDDLVERFSIEVVNKEFYQGIAQLFSELVGGSRYQGNKTIQYEPLLSLPSHSYIDNPEMYKEFAVRLIGRTVFCWFLKKKTSSKGIPLIPDEILSSKAVNHYSNGSYYHNVIEPLFFEILNTPIPKRKPQYRNNVYDAIPFLNGGLFEPLENDFYKGVANYALDIPNQWWYEILSFFETYHFTIDENTPVDVELSIDPEMLGRIFENLLAELNPETGETARKATGSFYTPRPIVDFMIDESLKHYLSHQLNLPPETFNQLIDYSTEQHGLNDEQKTAVLNALQRLKVLDPACGSGAFPMGMLQKIVLILQKIENYKTIEEQLNQINDPIVRDIIKRKLEITNALNDPNFNNYTHKLKVINQTIFGVDKQPIAVEISRLRCFLSLIVDEMVDDNKPNRGIEPLPNLDFKFVCADSLLKLPEENQYEKLFNKTNLIQQLENLRNSYFNANSEEKSQLRSQFEHIQQQLNDFIHKKENINVLSQINSRYYLLATWKPFKYQETSWFDPEWMFGVTNGFDIVIGNPPYIQLQKEGGKLAKTYQSQNYKTFTRKGDIYTLFYERGIELIKTNGWLCYITSNKWMRAGYGEKLREFFSKQNPLVLVDLGPNVFESATVDTNILIIQKAPNQNKLLATTINENKKDNINIAEQMKQHAVILTKLGKDVWFIASDIEQRIKAKIEAKGKPLKEWDINIYRGILTGYNEAFIIDGKKKDELIAQDPRSAEIIKPILLGRDIKRYKADFADLWLINTHNGVKEKGIPRIDVEKDYPAIYQHLKQYEPQLIKRQDKGDHWTNLRNCAYLQEFEKEKIVYNDICQTLTFSKVQCGTFFNNTAYFINHYSPYLLAILNSKIIDWYYRSLSVQLGEKAVRMFSIYVQNIPIPPLSEPEQQPFVALVEQILAKKEKGEDTTALEREIDNLVYSLYELTEEEIRIIEDKTKRKK